MINRLTVAHTCRASTAFQPAPLHSQDLQHHGKKSARQNKYSVFVRCKRVTKREGLMPTAPHPSLAQHTSRISHESPAWRQAIERLYNASLLEHELQLYHTDTAGTLHDMLFKRTFVKVSTACIPWRSMSNLSTLVTRQGT